MAQMPNDSLPRYKLLLRVHSAKELQYSSSQGAYCKLYVGSTTMTEGSHKALSKKDLNGYSTSSDDGEEGWHLAVRRTRTQHQQLHALETIWNETFGVVIHPNIDVATQILSIRVKSQHLLYCPVIGVCAVSLANLVLGKKVKQCFPLQKSKNPAGRIRVSLLITLDGKIAMASVPRRKQLNQDVVAARAANQQADEAVERLVANQLQREAQRQQLEALSCGPPERRLASQTISRNVDHQGPSAVSSPKVLPPLGIPAAFREQTLVHKHPNPPPTDQVPVKHMIEIEQRLDRKLRQVRKETARLLKLKMQLKKYIPDLQMDSDSNASRDSDEAIETLPFESFVAPVEQHHCRADSNANHRQNYSNLEHSKGKDSRHGETTMAHSINDEQATAVVS